MNDPQKYYLQEKSILANESVKLTKSIFRHSVYRFLVFLTTFNLGYFFFDEPSVFFTMVFIGTGIFIGLVLSNHRLKKAKDIVVSKIEVIDKELQCLDLKYHDFDEGNEFKNPSHYFSNDIDLFGKGSFFQYTNRTVTKEGKILLANYLTSNHIEDIPKKQEIINELSEKPDWRIHFSALAKLIKVAKSPRLVIDWMRDYQLRLPRKGVLISQVFSSISILLFVLLYVGIVPFSIIVFWFFLGLIITGFFIKKTQKIDAETSEIRPVFQQYAALLKEIENEQFSSKYLKRKQKKIQSSHKKASLIFKSFSKILDAFDQRNNLIIAVLGNGFLLYDLRTACKVESWIHQYAPIVKNWFEVVAFFDANNSLANFVFNHPHFNFPELHHDVNLIEANGLGHVLLDPKKRVDNEFSIKNEAFFIVTGANMAGKSTFLRTVSLSIVMANCGLPVCAASFKYRPIKLITSMRTSDSLTEEASYFYAELKRLKFIVDEMKSQEYFIILDEILKGTNSKDKALGSKHFVEKLTKTNSTGIIATHDVSLCELSKDYNTVSNYFFDAVIRENELYFDYTFKKGICKNMNASFLLKKMEII